MKTSLHHGLALAAISLAAVPLAACAKEGPGFVDRYVLGDERIVPFVDAEDGGIDDGAVPGRVECWSTSAWDGTWIPYGPHMQLDINHGLGRTPELVLVYISFTADGASSALAPGDLARVIARDERHVIVWNDTNGSYFARVVVK